jgi:SAM domain (Sterile alpha motif)
VRGVEEWLNSLGLGEYAQRFVENGVDLSTLPDLTDMVGFTAFSERSGEEAAFTLMRSLSKLMGEAVREPNEYSGGPPCFVQSC